MRIFVVVLIVLVVGCKSRHEKLPLCSVSPDPRDDGRYGITYYTDIEKAKECSASTGRKILLVFTGYAFLAETGMEWKILRTENVRELIDDQFILVLLYVDDKTEIPVTDSMIGRDGVYPIATIGMRNSALQTRSFEQNAQPYYAVVDTALNAIVPGSQYTKDSVAFANMLEDAIAK